MATDLKAATPDTTIAAGAFLFGADSQAAASPSVYPVDTTLAAYFSSLLNGQSTLSGATVTTTAPLLNHAQTWNAGGVTFTGWKLNITDTASASASLLMDLQVASASKFSVDKAGAIVTPSLSFGSIFTGTVGAVGTDLYLDAPSGNSVWITRNSTNNIFTRYTSSSIIMGSGISFGFGSTAGATTLDTILTRAGAAILQHGDADAASPVAQTIGVQNVVAGTSNTAGANFTIRGSAGTGTGAGGSIIFQTAPAGTTGTSQNTWTSWMTLDSTGLLTAPQSLTFGASGTYLVRYSGNNLGVGAGATSFDASMGSNGIIAARNAKIGWSSNTNLYTGISLDTILARDAANTLALVNGTNAQTFNVYNTSTSSNANYERGFLKWTSNEFQIGTEAGGTGSNRDLVLKAAGTLYLNVGGYRWLVNSAGHINAVTDNVYDIGASGASRARDAHIARNIVLGMTQSLGGGVGVINIGNANTAPTTDPTGGGILYCEGGALKYRGTSGTVTTLGAA